jgi:CDGSH-type Zn-finger protein
MRDRITLCRCGRSENKPFCNGAHAADPKFKDDI